MSADGFWDLYGRIRTAYKLGVEETDADAVLTDAYAMAGLAHDLLRALEVIAACDHAEDGGPECDHPEIADAALAAR